MAVELDTLAARLRLKNPGALSPALAAAIGATAAPVPPPHPGTRRLEDISFRIVDIEATGLSTVHDELIDVAVYELRRGALTKLIDTTVRPRQTVSPRILELTGLTAAELEHAPALADVGEALLVALSGDCLVAHNAQADVGYLSQIVQRFDPHWVCPPVACTLKLSRQLLAQETSAFSLRALAETLHLPLPSHRAASDALCTTRLLERLIIAAEAQGATTLDELLALAQRKTKARPEPLISPLDVDTLPDAPGVYRFFSSAGRLLYVGQSSSIRDRVRDHLYRAAAGASLEITRHASRVEATVYENELEAFVAEGDAIAAERPMLNVRSHEHGRVRYLRLSPGGALTVCALADDAPGARFFGPLVLARSERVVLRALRDTFGLTPRDPKRVEAMTHANIARFLSFATAPLGDKPASTDQPSWEVLLDVKRSIHRAEAEREDAARPFRTPTIVRSARGTGTVFAIGIGRRTLRTSEASVRAAVSAWLATEPTGNELDATARRISAYVRAHPKRVALEAAESAR